LSAICLLRSFSIVLAHAEALAATACSFRAMLALRTTGPQSTASCGWGATFVVLFDFSPASTPMLLLAASVAHERRGIGRHSAAVEPQPLSDLATGRALENAPLNSKRCRRSVGSNVHQAHFSATRQTFHRCPQPQLAEDK
jgi:hypothetical protein